MDSIRRFSKPTLRRPSAVVAFEGWNDACDAASGAVTYLLSLAEANEPFAVIDPEEFFDFQQRRPTVQFDEGGTRSRRFGLTFYFPLADRFNLAWNNQYFASSGGASDGVRGAIAGGSPPLRGYPLNRWRDRFGVFHGLDLRFNIPMGVELDFFLARGVLEDLQLAVFYEVGQVSPEDNSSLYDDLRQSYGFGVRMLLRAIVLRLDLAFSDEGPQTHLTVGQAF